MSCTYVCTTLSTHTLEIIKNLIVLFSSATCIILRACTLDFIKHKIIVTNYITCTYTHTCGVTHT